MQKSAPKVITTSRLTLRQFTIDDIRPLGRIFSDPQVTQYLPRGPYRAGEAAAIAQRTILYFIDHWREHGFGVWAVVERTSGSLIGQCGLNTLEEAPEIEVLYLLDRPFWGRGLATEAARAALEVGFRDVALSRIVGLTLPGNIASQRVLEKIGLRYEKDARFFNLDVRYFAIEQPSS